MSKFSVSVRPYDSAKRPNAKWVLNVWHPTGRRERRFFVTKKLAEAEAKCKEADFENHGRRGLELDDRLRSAALEAKEKLDPLGVSRSGVVADCTSSR